MQTHRNVLVFAASALCLGTTILLTGAAHPARASTPEQEVQLSFSRIYWEYNSSANDLGVHVTLDGEDWTQLEIENPDERILFKVSGRGPYRDLGMTELFFEGAEPSLDEFPLQDLLDLFPEGEYEFSGLTAGGEEIEGEWMFTHAIPDGPDVFADVGPKNRLRIRWNEVTAPPPGFPNEPIHIVGYQVIVGTFQVTLPATARSVTVPPEYVQALGHGVHPFEVLAIEASANQTLTEGTFTL
ncbi:MAG: hypothetical protein HOP15_12805 [Planctomycetes bacterium]|nr:hypothetical protein [Planctomycetota bacterium]